jgi:predicted GNAT superfamily acetyltransferase
MYWTYDPLVARNAHLNLTVLGAEVDGYVRDMYGVTNSPVHDVLGTDRFVVRWRLDGERLAPGEVVATIAIPLSIEEVQIRSAAEAAAWRARTRDAFERAAADGLRVSGFRISGSEALYTLSHR